MYSMFMNLNIEALGFRLPFNKAVEVAAKTGFKGVDINIEEAATIAEQHGEHFVTAALEEKGLKAGGWHLPLNWRDEEAYRSGLKRLPELAKLASEIGCLRAYTWIMPYSDNRSYRENFEWHVNRFKPVASILDDYGCMLALEFIGTPSVRRGHRYEFIYTMEGMLELCNAIGIGNVGLLLDSWHWYTSGGSLDDLRSLSPRQVVYVHINDAPRGIPIEDLVDTVRHIPGETGVIDLKGFLSCLAEIGYDGPVTPEPFSKELSKLTPLKAAETVYRSLIRVWREAGLE